MTERPITLIGQEVRAILDGRQSQLRRLVKPQPPEDWNEPEEGIAWRGPLTGFCGRQRILRLRHDNEIYEDVDVVDFPAQSCPYGIPGDLLWVREEWGPCAGGVVYRADDDGATVRCPDGGRWCSPIHMPRWASRITLEVTSVRVERLQAISDADAFASGIQQASDEGIGGDGTARGTYRALWESIHGQGSWNVNPFVWVIEFRRITP